MEEGLPEDFVEVGNSHPRSGTLSRVDWVLFSGGDRNNFPGSGASPTPEMAQADGINVRQIFRRIAGSR